MKLASGTIRFWTISSSTGFFFLHSLLTGGFLFDTRKLHNCTLFFSPFLFFSFLFYFIRALFRVSWSHSGFGKLRIHSYLLDNTAQRVQNGRALSKMKNNTVTRITSGYLFQRSQYPHPPLINTIKFTKLNSQHPNCKSL